jgi:putative transposase
MRKTFQYRVYPNRKQRRVLTQTLEECRWVYNETLAFRKQAWEERHESVSLYDTHMLLPGWKQERPTLKLVHSQVLQNVQVRVDLAYKAFFRRVKAGENPGYPRFRGCGRYDSMTYPQSGFSLKNGFLKLSKMGNVKIKLHRVIEGKIKTLTLRKTATGKWYACFSCIVEPKPLPVTDKVVGIDVGLTHFATLSNGEQIENPRFFRRDEKALARAQHRFSKEAKGTPERAKRRKVIARIHERIANRRKNFAHQQSRRLVNRFSMIAIEDIAVNSMLHNHCLAKSISDAAWAQFLGFLQYKAEYAGRRVIPINPAYTSQNCSSCGHRQALCLSERIYRCACCGLIIDRDHNAALNILAIGLKSLNSFEGSTIIA